MWTHQTQNFKGTLNIADTHSPPYNNLENIYIDLSLNLEMNFQGILHIFFVGYCIWLWAHSKYTLFAQNLKKSHLNIGNSCPRILHTLDDIYINYWTKIDFPHIPSHKYRLSDHILSDIHIALCLG